MRRFVGESGVSRVGAEHTDVSRDTLFWRFRSLGPLPDMLSAMYESRCGCPLDTPPEGDRGRLAQWAWFVSSARSRTMASRSRQGDPFDPCRCGRGLCWMAFCSARTMARENEEGL